MIVQYTALRSLLPNHTAEELHTLEIDLTDARRGRSVEKNVIRAMSGRTETLWHRSQTVWPIVTRPVKGHEKAALTEFLDSTGSGEEFLAWLYGDESTPISVRRADNGYAWQRFMSVGGELTDYFITSITIAEIE